jgi:hypothetical protein
MNLRHRQKWRRSKASLGLCFYSLDVCGAQRRLIKVRPDSSVLKGSKLSGHRSESKKKVLIKHLQQIVRSKANEDGEKKKRETERQNGYSTPDRTPISRELLTIEAICRDHRYTAYQTLQLLNDQLIT